MQENLEPIFIEEQKQGKDSSINIEKLLSKAIVYWPWFLVVTLLCCTIGYVYLRYATPKYMVNARVLVNDEKQSSVGEGQILEGLGLQANAANVENEVEIFKSRTLMKKVVGELQSNIHYYASGAVKTGEHYYKDIPFRFVPIFDNYNVAFRYKYQIEVKGAEGFTLSDKKQSWTASWGDTLDLPVGKAVIIKQPAPAYNITQSTIEIKPTEYQAIKTLRTLKVLPVKNATILELSIADVLPKRGEDVLDKLVEVYMQENVDNRNKTLNATVDFINERLVVVSSELADIEKDIEQFKSNNNLTDLSEQAKMLLDYTSDYQKEITQQEVKLRVINAIEQHVKNSVNSGRTIPPTLLTEDAVAIDALNQYNNLLLRRSQLLLSNTEDNPYVKNLDVQIAQVREDIKSSLASTKQGVRISIDALKQRAGGVEGKVRQVPQKEREYLEYARQQNIKQELYVFLLKKREETAISKSYTVANARVIDPAKSDGAPFTPQSGRVYLICLALGLLLPTGWIFAKELFNIKLSSKDDVAAITKMGVTAEIGHNSNDEDIVVEQQSKTVIAEQFRALRTNMQFLLSSEDEKVILLTSSMSGEGKSFVALNLATTLALSGKKVVLMELDLRKPKISESLNIKNAIGFTEYLIGQVEQDKIIHPSGVVDSLYVVPSGAIPPNPSELLMSSKADELFDSLKQDFDYIVVDTAPVGLVTDAQLLSKKADTVLYVARMGYTYKEQLRNANELYVREKIKNMSLILNDVKSRTSVYGYGSYNQHYFDNNSQGGLAKRIKRIFKKP